MKYRDPAGPLSRSMDEDWWATPEVLLLRSIYDALTGSRTLLTESERRSVDPDRGRWTALSPDELDRRLGLTTEAVQSVG